MALRDEFNNWERIQETLRAAAEGMQALNMTHLQEMAQMAQTSARIGLQLEESLRPTRKLFAELQAASDVLAPFAESLKIIDENLLQVMQPSTFSLAEILGKPPVFPLIESPLFPALADIASLIDPKILDALAHPPDYDDNPSSAIVSAETASNLPEGPRPIEPRPLDTDSKLALLGLLVAILVVTGYMKPDEGSELLGLLVLLMSLLPAQRR